MRVLFITPYFPPEVGAAQTRIHELAVRLARLGSQVSILTTFPNYPSGIVPPGWRGKRFCKCEERGLTVYRVWSYAAPNRGFMKRIAAHLSFAFFASLATLVMPRSDVAVIESPPLFDGFTGLFVNLFRRTPYAFTVSDLWPESAVQMGMLENKFLIWASKRIELAFYRRAAVVLALTAGIQRKIIAEGISPFKVVLFRNSVDCDFFHPGLSTDRIRAELGFTDSEFIALYAGNLGHAQNLDTILEAAAQLRKHRDVRILLAGDGAESERLKQKARSMQLNNVLFVASMPKTRMPELVNVAGCVLVPLRDLEIFQGALPTKLFEAMATAKPVVLSVRGEAAELLQEAKAGHCVPPESASEISKAVIALYHDAKQASEMGKRGRDFVQRHFSRDARAQELSAVLKAANRAAGPKVVADPMPGGAL